MMILAFCPKCRASTPAWQSGRVNKQVYEVIVKNPAVYDGVTCLKPDAHKNLIATGTAPTIESVQK